MAQLLHLLIPSSTRGDESGASLVEYALLLAFIVIACVGALEFFGISLLGSFSNSGSAIDSS